jgi:TPR repeat protein
LFLPIFSSRFINLNNNHTLCFTQKRKTKDKDSDEIHNCDRHCANGMGLISLLGIDGLVDRNVANARKWFEIAKDLGDSDGQFNYAMLRLGWMVTEVRDGHDSSTYSSDTTPPYFDHGNAATTPHQLNYLVYRRHKSSPDDTSGPSASDYAVAMSELSRAASKGHMQAKHKLAMLHATGAEVHKKSGSKATVAVAVKQSCIQSLQYYKSIAESGHTFSKRNRAAWKQYNNGDYESALRNYIATAESGSVVGQMNAAFLLERGYCLGMSTEKCTRARYVQLMKNVSIQLDRYI